MDESMDSRLESMSHIEDLNKQLEQNFMEFIQNKEDGIEDKHSKREERTRKDKLNSNSNKKPTSKSIWEMEILHKREVENMAIEIEQIKESAIEIVSQKEQQIQKMNTQVQQLEEYYRMEMEQQDIKVSQLNEHIQKMEEEFYHEKQEFQQKIQEMNEYNSEQEQKHQEELFKIQHICDQKIEERYEELRSIQSRQQIFVQETQYQNMDDQIQEEFELRQKLIRLTEQFQKEKENYGEQMYQMQQVQKMQQKKHEKHIQKVENLQKQQTQQDMNIIQNKNIEIQSLNTKNNKLRDQIHDLQQQIAQLVDENGQLQTECQQLQQNKLIYQDQVKKIEQKYELLVDQIQQKHFQEKSQLQDEIEEYKSINLEISSQQNQKEVLQNQQMFERNLLSTLNQKGHRRQRSDQVLYTKKDWSIWNNGLMDQSFEKVNSRLQKEEIKNMIHERSRSLMHQIFDGNQINKDIKKQKILFRRESKTGNKLQTIQTEEDEVKDYKMKGNKGHEQKFSMINNQTFSSEYDESPLQSYGDIGMPNYQQNSNIGLQQNLQQQMEQQNLQQQMEQQNEVQIGVRGVQTFEKAVQCNISQQQSFNQMNESRKKKYLQQLYEAINDITLYIQKLEKVIESGQQFNAFIQLEKVQRMYVNSYELLQLMNNQYKMIIFGLAEKTINKLSAKSLSIYNQFNIISIVVPKFRVNQNHVEYEIHLQDELLIKNWIFHLRFSEVQKFDQLLKRQLPQQELLQFVPKIPKKTWFKQIDKEFLEQRKLELEVYFKQFIESENGLMIIDYSNIKDTILRKIQENLTQNLQNEDFKMKNWYQLIHDMPVNKAVHNQNNNDCISKDFLKDVIQHVKQEVKILTWKFSKIKNDIQMLDQNDTFLLMQYHQKTENLKQ